MDNEKKHKLYVINNGSYLSIASRKGKKVLRSILDIIRTNFSQQDFSNFLGSSMFVKHWRAGLLCYHFFVEDAVFVMTEEINEAIN